MLIKIRSSQTQRSESLLVGSILAFSGGYMDAYTYLCRDHVFANAQTGNMILFGINLSQGNWILSLEYLYPVIFFVFGIALSHLICTYFKNNQRIHWRQIAVAIEILVLFIVGFLNSNFNMLANCMVSFTCGVQVQSFRSIHGYNLATTMCIGNIRSATDCLCSYWHSKDKKQLRASMLYYEIIGVFILGATFGYIVVKEIGMRAVWLNPFYLTIVFLLMWEGRQKLKSNPKQKEPQL